ncbi:hypothetical protein W59_10544 [Rhodococcus opacus RKJ300 = JCM 13270]|uniref:Uncharacterized protein n=1 Tax=Rhodococcus opacus RKJ300 = JCM 13270 TaxID=1165867 RepID=I0WUC0_RHOOP|nr:hypothetical protein W59_10544 [Rhodococcus opacus RKJ300 = JCM 13270]
MVVIAARRRIKDQPFADTSALLSILSVRMRPRRSRWIVGYRPQAGAGPSAGVGDQCPEPGGVFAECLLQVGSDVFGDVWW